MPRTPKPTPKKQETHAKIVRTAAAAIRKHGYHGVSVAEIMDDAGLTHGGFYAHFASRDAMLAEAFDQGAAESLERLTKAAASGEGDPLEALVASYLSDRHLAAPDKGCTLAALGSETSRAPAEVRRVATRRFVDLVDLVARQIAAHENTPARDTGAAHDKALGVVSAMVGAMMIARAVDDPALAKAVRSAAARLIRAA